MTIQYVKFCAGYEGHNYIGGDFYSYTYKCGHCQQFICGWTEEEAYNLFINHRC